MSIHTTSKILLDTLNPSLITRGVRCRLTTFEIVFPRVILAEVNTHRMLSKNTASSRAIPFNKFLNNVREQTYIPKNVGFNNKGMSSFEQLSPDQQEQFEKWCQELFEMVADKCTELNADLNIHKQWMNRYLEPWMYVTMIISGTDWNNFFALRTHKDAHPDIQILANQMYEQYKKSEPEFRTAHTPLIQPSEIAELDQIQKDKGLTDDEMRDFVARVSAGRCARVSYLTHDGVRDFDKDLELASRLCDNFPKHMTPFEHVAYPMTCSEYESNPRSGNFEGFIQYRKLIDQENITEFNGWN